MRRLWRSIQQITSPKTPYRNISDLRPFQPGDRVLLRPKSSRNVSATLTLPLKPGLRLDTHKGSITHDDILGKRVRDIVCTGPTKSAPEGTDFRLYEVRLEEYVRFTRRLVTPLYPQDARLIVDLLDLHVQAPQWGHESAGPKIEILEAGTGHGALTLYLSRAIHGGNRPLPLKCSDVEDEEDHVALGQWKSTRRAVIHTIEVSPRYSTHAQKIVKGFRKGMYHHNVDFHVANVSEWTRATLERRGGEAFLSHAFLDLPSTEEHLSAVTAALRVDGALIVFCPSITQIMACMEKVKTDAIPLDLERVLELGVNGGTGGREWDVRAVRPRAAVKANEAAREVVRDGEDSGVEVSDDDELPVEGAEKARQGDKGGFKMVCRPKVGEMVVGGGFLGVFRKQRM
ncbi:hypothetical protein BAUCODRAFT_35597 [Baudoinia panamericana UAMH 10762]|uniref:tRNA (adenine(58)-N(1))-methyltransferase catalytic subunit TRM61 n=1 Tax=Baudoinia panamericana (strain UAMH 10762) TaxID=717646 RepID=M2MCX6_BAUPA|nr:uncharacterized protein BAUCODRAFT_35597 [Baudoinia panamericana UAMH 10762]EMC94386.1 hypothetical protein BAUCODRAFT_35597 [Baudoinia panamericana UAMH 10762]